jgi:hypothetical protein
LHLTYESEISLKRQYRTCGPTWALSKVPDAVKEWIARSEDADGRTSPGENFRHRIGKRAKAIAAASERPASGNANAMRANSYRAGIAMNWEPERKAARRKCSKALAPISRHYPQERGARFAEGGGRFAGMPRITLRLRYLTLKLRALCWVLRRLRAMQALGHKLGY